MKVTRYVGTCPVCERYHRLHKQRTMVHHGYRRPGGGHGIIGDCLGVGWPAWELSPEGTVEYLRRVRHSIDVARQHLEDLEEGRITQLSVQDGYELGWGKRMPKYKTVTAGDGPIFERALAAKIKETSADIRDFQGTETYLLQKLPTWTLQPLITEEEEQRRRESTPERLQRKVALDAAREAREAKRSASEERKRKRVDEKLALMREYRDVFNTLAFRVDETQGPERETVLREAREQWKAMRKRKQRRYYLDFDERELGINEALFKLELAAPAGRGWSPGYIHYANDFGGKVW